LQERKSFSAAHVFCEAAGGSLADIKDEQTYAFIQVSIYVQNREQNQRFLCFGWFREISASPKIKHCFSHWHLSKTNGGFMRPFMGPKQLLRGTLNATLWKISRL
jgi:hypothetical protein